MIHQNETYLINEIKLTSNNTLVSSLLYRDFSISSTIQKLGLCTFFGFEY